MIKRVCPRARGRVTVRGNPLCGIDPAQVLKGPDISVRGRATRRHPQSAAPGTPKSCIRPVRQRCEVFFRIETRTIDPGGASFGRVRLPPNRYFDACTYFAAQQELRPPEIRARKTNFRTQREGQWRALKCRINGDTAPHKRKRRKLKGDFGAGFVNRRKMERTDPPFPGDLRSRLQNHRAPASRRSLIRQESAGRRKSVPSAEWWGCARTLDSTLRRGP